MLAHRRHARYGGGRCGEKDAAEAGGDHDGSSVYAAVLSDNNGVSAQALIEESSDLAKERRKGKREELLLSLDGELSARHRLMLERLRAHIHFLEPQIGGLDTLLIEAMQPYRRVWELLQTIPISPRVSGQPDQALLVNHPAAIRASGQ